MTTDGWPDGTTFSPTFTVTSIAALEEFIGGDAGNCPEKRCMIFAGPDGPLHVKIGERIVRTPSGGYYVDGQRRGLPPRSARDVGVMAGRRRRGGPVSGGDHNQGEGRCDTAPRGWYCTRRAGHDGPCAAWPTRLTRIRYTLTGGRLPR